MKILLTAVNAKYIHSNPAVYSIRAYAKKYLEHIALKEYTINQKAEEILTDIFLEAPDIVAISVYIWNREMVDILLEEIPKVLPKARIVLGGPEAANDAQSLLKRNNQIDCVMDGEGEATFEELCQHYIEKNIELSEIKGLILREKRTGVRPFLDMDELPFFYEEWGNEKNLGPFKNKIIYYETSRGCPFRCSYCLSSLDKTVRLKSLEKVYKELQFFLDRRVPQVKFIDRTFNANAKHALSIWTYLLEHDNGVTNFHFEVEADILTREEIDVISKMRPGLIQLEIGVQTTNKEVLKAINRKEIGERMLSNIASIHAVRNTHQHLDLIAGLPYEDMESFKRSFNEVYDMKPDQLQLGFLKVLKGTQIACLADEYGIKALGRPPYEVLSTNWMTYENMIALKRIENVVEIYYNSNQFTKTIPFLVKQFENPYRFFEELAAYFESKGYFLNQPARVFRYNILLEFAISFDASKEKIVKELLTCDMYLRENMKSRPSFARDLSSYKEEIYRREKHKKDHIEVFDYPVFQENTEDISAPSNEPYFVLFNYDHVDPLSKNAKMILV